jgi:hypothetical protein
MILFKKQLFDLEVKGQGPTKVIMGNKFSKLDELFCNYKETFYVLVTNLTLCVHNVPAV